jgi:hypothetical protein
MKLGYRAREVAAHRSRSRSVPLEHGKPRGVAQPDIYQELKAIGPFDEAGPQRGRPLGSAPTESRCDVLDDALQGVSVVFDT